MKKISVIVPIYNVEKYLQRCIESLICQKVEMEILLINDGSTDNSGEIAMKYANQYPEKIKYLEKENGGLSDARNYGVERATGDYLAFVDADDYLEPTIFGNLLPWMEQKIQLIKYKAIKISEEGKEIEKIEGPVFEKKTGEEAFAILFPEDTMLEAAWLYLYERQFYFENAFQFSKGTYHEDFGLIPLIVTIAKNVVSTSFFGYYYVQSEGSITRNGNYEKTKKRVYDILIHYDNMLSFIGKHAISLRAADNLKIYFTNALLLKIEELQEKEQADYIAELKKRKIAKNIKPRNIKQLLKRMLITINMKWYLKIR